LSVFESPSKCSSSDALQNTECSRHVPSAGNEFEVLQVGLTLGGGNRTVPIWLIHADEHSFDHVFCLIVERLCVINSTALSFQSSKHGQVARNIVAITDALAGRQALSGTAVSSRQIAAVAIQFCQFEHRIRFHSVKLHTA